MPSAPESTTSQSAKLNKDDFKELQKVGVPVAKILEGIAKTRKTIQQMDKDMIDLRPLVMTIPVEFDEEYIVAVMARIEQMEKTILKAKMALLDFEYWIG